MFPFSRDSKDKPAEDPMPEPEAQPVHPLDELTGGAFSAATSGERAQRVRDWIESDPAPEQMQAVFKELSAKDKGAAKALRERLDELRREREQDAVAEEWQAKAQALLDSARLNIADALAWQRDAARAGAPLSREPLASLRTQLTERIKGVEDLQQRVMVQREAAALLAQRIELLSTKSWTEAQHQQTGLQDDLAHWREQAQEIIADTQWPSVELRFPPQLEAAQSQLEAVWDAFVAALAQAVVAADDKTAVLPSVPIWAEELQAARDKTSPAASQPAARRQVDSEQGAAAAKAVEAGVMLLEQAVVAGNTKNMNSATQSLRQSLKAHGRLIDDALEARVHAALVSAGELGGWQRWSADKAREQLVARAEALLVKRPIKDEKKRPKRKSRPADPQVSEAAEVEVEVDARVDAASATETPPQPQPEAASEQPTAGAVSTAPEEAQPVAQPDLIEDAAVPAADEVQDVAGEVAAQPEGKTVTVDAVDAPAEAAAPAAAADAARADTPEPDAEAASADDEDLVALEEGFEWVPAVGGRKLQDAIRKLREEWKTADQGGPPNHKLWKRFDRACNAAYEHVETWLQKMRAESEANKAQRLGLIQEVQAWTAAQQGGPDVDWKEVNRQVRQFADRWRRAGHLSERLYAELQPQWKAAIQAAAAPLEAEQKASITRRQALIDQAQTLGDDPNFRIDAVRQLQQHWQNEARIVPLERRREQRLWDAFRKPIDEAFKRRDAEREQQRAAMSVHDKRVLDAARALEEANASGDAERIREALAELEAATRAQPPAPRAPDVAVEPATAAPTEVQAPAAAAEQDQSPQADAAAESTETEGHEPADVEAEAPEPAPTPAPAPTRPVVAVRGDDRPGARRASAGATEGRGGRRDDRRPGGRDRRDDRDGPRHDRAGGRQDRYRAEGPRGPRLGDAAFRAQRNAVDNAEAALRKLAAQAHGEALMQLLSAWRDRQAEQVPATGELGRGVNGAVRSDWVQAIEQGGGQAPKAATALLRLEMAAEVPTPADQLDARRQLQLLLLTQRNDPSPAETWTEDTAAVLASAHDEASARRLQNALKALMRKR